LATGVLGESGAVFKEGDFGGLKSETLGEMGGEGRGLCNGEVGSGISAASVIEGSFGELTDSPGVDDETGDCGFMGPTGVSGRLCRGTSGMKEHGRGNASVTVVRKQVEESEGERYSP
jgi:hypothetical protein